MHIILMYIIYHICILTYQAKCSFSPARQKLHEYIYNEHRESSKGLAVPQMRHNMTQNMSFSCCSGGMDNRCEGQQRKFKEPLKRNKCIRTGTGACRFAQLSLRDVWPREPRGLCSAARDHRVRSRDRIRLHKALHGARGAGPVFLPAPGGCQLQASHNFGVTAGADGLQGSSPRTEPVPTDGL